MNAALASYLRFLQDLGIDAVRVAPANVAPLAQPIAAAAESAPVPVAQAKPAEAPRPANTGLFASSEKPLESNRKPAPNVEEALRVIREDIGECTRCRLHEGRTNLVFGVGDAHAKLVFVGEGPGADEDAQGIPFVGRAGQLLTKMIDNTAEREGIPVRRDDVYICNVVKCRPPGNRTPEPDEMDICGQFLYRQLEAIAPRAICVLGGTAAKALLNTRVGITKLRGEWQQWRGIPVMPTYHPSFLLRYSTPEKKKEAWMDLKKALHFAYEE